MAKFANDVEQIWERVQKLQDSFNTFLAKYGHQYPANLLSAIRKNSLQGYDCKSGELENVMSQIYSYIGVYSDYEDVYKGLFDGIRFHFGADRNWVGLYEGYLPMLGSHLAKEQQEIGRGSVTLYDPRTIETSFGNIRVFRNQLPIDVRLSGADAIYAINDKVEEAVQIAVGNNLDFFAICPNNNEQGFIRGVESIIPDNKVLLKTNMSPLYGLDNQVLICKEK